MKILGLLLLCLALGALLVEAIPNNCVQCTTDLRILCRKPIDGYCKILTSTSGGTSTMKDYTLVGSFNCPSLTWAQDMYCVAGKEAEPEWHTTSP